MKVAISGIPRGYQRPRHDGNWLTEPHRAQIRAVSDRIELLEVPADRVDDVEGIEVLLAEGGNSVHYPGELDRADYERFFTPSLRWVQVCSTGFSDNITPQILDGTVTLTNSPGIHTNPIAESVLAAMLAHAKCLAQRASDQARHAWNRLDADELSGRIVLIIGVGRIGGRVAQLCKAFEMRVTGVRRSGAPAPHVDRVFPPADLRRILPEADFVVVATPHTSATTNLLDTAAFALLKPSAYLINVGRGAVVDEVALLAALRERRLAGAYLDTFVTEPLPADHPFWDLPNVQVVPHDSHSSPHIGDRLVDLFCANLRRYIAGEPLLDVCDPHRGY